MTKNIKKKSARYCLIRNILVLSIITSSLVSIYAETTLAQSQIILPEVYLEEGSHTTPLNEMSLNELETVKDLTFEIVNRNKITFKDTLDLSSPDAIEIMNNLDKQLKFNEIGKISINENALEYLTGPVQITLYNLPYETTPKIYINGEPVTNDQVSNIVFISSINEGGTLYFDAESFFDIELGPSQNKEEYYNEENRTGITGTNRLLLLIGIITLIGIIVSVFVKIIEKKKNEDSR